MDVNDLKGLFAEVKKRMDAQLDHVRRELAGVRTGRASVDDPRRGARRGLRLARCRSTRSRRCRFPEPTLIVAQPFDPSLMGAIEKAIRTLEPRAQPDQRRQGGAHPDPGADRGAPQGAVEARPQVRRGRAQRRPPGPPRRQRPAEEAAQGSHASRKTTSGAASTTCRRSPTSTSALIDELQKKKDAELLNK